MREKGTGAEIARIYDLLRTGQRGAAVDAIRKERLAEPQNTYLMAVEADVLLRAGQTAAAEVLLGEIFARDPGNKKALVVKADVLLQKGEAEEALAVLRTHPDQNAPHVARRLVNAHFRAGHYREALVHAQEALRQAGTDTAWFKGMAARCLEKMGDTGQAAEFWRESGTREGSMNVIRLKLKNLEPERALAELRAMARLYDRDAEFHVLWAEQLLAANRAGEAADHWLRAAALRPGNTYYLGRAAFTLQKAGRAEEALERFKEAVLLNPADRWTRAALFRLLANRPAEAAAFLEEVLRVHPGAGWPHGYLKKIAGSGESSDESQ